MRNEYPNLEIAAATLSTDKDAIGAWKSKVGAEFAILHGVSERTTKAYGVTSYPTYRVLDANGGLAGSDEAALKARLAGS